MSQSMQSPAIGRCVVTSMAQNPLVVYALQLNDGAVENNKMLRLKIYLPPNHPFPNQERPAAGLQHQSAQSIYETVLQYTYQLNSFLSSAASAAISCRVRTTRSLSRSSLLSEPPCPLPSCSRSLSLAPSTVDRATASRQAAFGHDWLSANRPAGVIGNRSSNNLSEHAAVQPNTQPTHTPG